MDFVSTAIVVAIVVVLMLLGIGMVVNQLIRLKKWLNAAPRTTRPATTLSRPGVIRLDFVGGFDRLIASLL